MLSASLNRTFPSFLFNLNINSQVIFWLIIKSHETFWIEIYQTWNNLASGLLRMVNISVFIFYREHANLYFRILKTSMYWQRLECSQIKPKYLTMKPKEMANETGSVPPFSTADEGSFIHSLINFSLQPVIHDWYVLSCLWDGAYKRTLAVNRKE